MIQKKKKYIKPRSWLETRFTTKELLVVNPQWIEYSWGAGWSIDQQIDVGDVEIQDKYREDDKGTNETWGDLW